MIALILLMHTHVYKFIMPSYMPACVYTYVCVCMRVCMFRNTPPPKVLMLTSLARFLYIKLNLNYIKI